MRRSIQIIWAVIAALPGLGATSQAQVANSSTAVLVESTPLQADTLRATVIARLAAMRERQRGGPEKEWLGQLHRLYLNRDGLPFWVKNGTWNEEAQAALAEVAKAREWGLDPKALEVPSEPAASATPDQLANAEIAASMVITRYVWHARGGRVDPSQLSRWLDQRPRATDASEVVAEVAGAHNPASTLRRMHPRHPQFEALRQAYLKAVGLAPALTPLPVQTVAAPAVSEPVIVPKGPRLKPGDTHRDIAVIRRRLGVPAGPGGETTYDDRLADAVLVFRREAGMRSISVINEWLREALNKAEQRRLARVETTDERPAARTSKSAAVDLKRLIVNMERWRWMPEQLGDLYVWNNLPEFETHVIKDGNVVHEERIIIGKATNQTPVFSDRMRYVVFQPEWGVPSTIKVQDLLPALQDGDHDILSRRDMRILINGRTRDPSDFKWDRVDIRNVPIVQDPGSKNPLGTMKFMFPNRHDVYMHDTPNKGLFNSAQRTFSFGCIRVRNPRKFAELIFAEDQGWSKTEVASQIDNADSNTKVDLKRSIPVHNVYFTVVAGPDGVLRTFADMYGHDKRIREALDGRPIAEIAEEDPALKLERDLEEIAPRQQVTTSGRNSTTSGRPGSRGGRGGDGFLN